MGHKSVRSPVDHLLDGSETPGNVQDRVAAILEQASGGALHAGQFGKKRRPTRAGAWRMVRGHLGLEQRATADTAALVQQEMGDLHVDGGQLDHWMGLVERGGDKRTLATGTRCWIEVLHLDGLKQSGAGARMAFSPATCAR